MNSTLDQTSNSKSFRNCGIFTGIRPILQPPQKSRYQTLVNDLKETTYRSYWNKEVGAHTDTTGKLPANVDIYETTFGKKSTIDVGVASLMKFYESEKSKELTDYLHRKEMRKKEVIPTGKKEKLYNPHGSIVNCCMHVKPYETCTVGGEIQANYFMNNTTKLGKSVKAYEFPPSFTNYTGEIPYYHGLAGVFAENMQERMNCQEYMSYMNSFRLRLKKRFTEHGLDFQLIYCALKYYDKENAGWIPYSIVCDVCKYFRVIFDKMIVAKYLEATDIKRNEYINYRRFVDLLNWQKHYPDKVNLNYYT